LLKQKLVTLDPQAVLQRGYAVVRQENGAIARSAAEFAPGQALQIQLGQGQLKVKITEVLNTSFAN
jgi:exodeoxyribonuclease VII large subunit